MLYKEINSFKRCFRFHKSPFAAEKTVSGKAVSAAEIAVVRNVQADSPDRRYFRSAARTRRLFRGEQFVGIVKLDHLIVAAPDIFFFVKLLKLFKYIFRAYRIKWRFDVLKHVVCEIIYYMYAAAVYVDYYVVSCCFKFVDHKLFYPPVC